MIKLRDLIDEKKCGVGQNPEDTGCEPASGEKGKEKKDEKPKKKGGLPGIDGRTCSIWIRHRTAVRKITGLSRNGQKKNYGRPSNGCPGNSGPWL